MTHPLLIHPLLKYAVLLFRPELEELETSIIVNKWDHIGGLSARGWRREAFHKEFSLKERRRLAGYHKLFHLWQLRMTCPPHHIFKSKHHVEFIKRSVKFFKELK